MPRSGVGLKEFERKFERERDSWRTLRKDSDDRKTYDEVFDKDNLMRIYKLFSDGVIDQVDFPISTGKEGNVFRALTRDGKYLALKIFRTSTATFKDMAKYVAGDPRFKGISRNRKKMIMTWSSKEFRNLQRFAEAGVRVPKAVACHQNMIVMEYIGTDSSPAPMMRSVQLKDPSGVAEKLLVYVRRAYSEGGLVHGDLSEFNVLMDGDEPVLIDVGQSVLLRHPMAEELLDRDIGNIARYFRKYGLNIDIERELKEIRKR
ncbi:MAG: serine protein kinase RIO [Methanobacteriota archaeon]|nr:MAG: serine protein kinase RIO [Euryarchaeota archaeon]